jgi:hypothetical protein
MSLLTTVASGSVGTKYYIENLGGNGDQPDNAVPCIKTGDAFGAIRISDPGAGLVIVGGGIGNTPLVGGIRGGGASGTTLTLGSSVASATNIVLTDGLVTVSGDMVLSGAGSDLSVGGNINLVNGQSAGKSISGYYAVSTAVAGTGAQANPAGLTAGVYNVLYVATGGAVGQAPSGVFVWSGTQWFGNAIGANFTAGVPDIAILPTAGNATLTIGGGAPSVPGALFWRKLLN